MPVNKLIDRFRFSSFLPCLNEEKTVGSVVAGSSQQD